MSTAIITPTDAVGDRTSRAERPTYDAIPMRTIMGVELRKMFDTRSGYWMMWSVVILSVLATASLILFAPDDAVTYGNFAGAIGIPMSIILPMIAVLSVTSEWSQRTGLTTFTMVSSRNRVIAAKLVNVVLVAVVSIATALGIGVLGNLVGSQLAGVDTVWDFGVGDMFYVLGGNLLGMLMGFTLGVLFRNSAAAIVGYFVYAMVIPTLSGVLASAQDWYSDLQRWVDFQANQVALYDGDFTARNWAELAVTGAVWLALPLAFGLWRIVRSEVK